MPYDPLSHRILEHIADRRYQPKRAAALAQEMGVSPAEWDDFQRIVGQLIQEGQVVLSGSDSLALPPPGREMIGVFRASQRGFGFLVPDSPVGHGDLFVPAGSTMGALSGDRVRATVLHEPRRAGGGRSPYVGRVVEIVQRADRRYVGNLRKAGSRFVVEVDGTALRDPVVIRDPHAKNAKPGDKVVVELLQYPSEMKPGEGVIVEVLGEQGEPDIETLGIMKVHGLNERFADAVTLEARAIAESFSETALEPGREDLTGTLTLTIDPPDAKDYDDAISIRRLGDGESAAWELGVHIAHVAHFVRSGGELDREAKLRGNSTYLPRRVVPMLPEILSNGICSLQENVSRFCLSVFLRYDAQGRVLSQRFARTVIRSAKRLTYLEAQALIDDNLREAIHHAKAEPKYPRKVIEALKLMNELAQVIRKRRLKEGMIVLGLPEVELVFDETGRVIDAVPEDDAFTHKLIEMFMVEANEAAARAFSNLHVPMIRRTHAEPPSHDLSELKQFAKVAGIHMPARPTRKELQMLLDASRGKPTQHAVHLAVLQTLSRAEYSPALIGHFALASEHYTHFTSPIRRYPDLVVHRGLDALLDAQVRGKPEAEVARRLRSDPRLLPEEALEELGKHCSTTERNSEAAERELRTYLVLDLLASKLGEDFEGTVTGMSGQGLFVQLDKYLVDGFVSVDDLPSQHFDTWRLNRVTGAMVAQRSGRSIRIGDRFIVRIAKVNPPRRQLELAIIGDYGKPAKQRDAVQPITGRKGKEFAIRLKRERREKRRRRR